MKVGKMIMRRGLFIVFLLPLFILTACETPVSSGRFPEITFGHLKPIGLDVAEIVYTPKYQPPISPPNVGHDFPTPPVRAAERWIADRLVATGTRGRAIVTIREAAATETGLKVKKGVTGAFTTDQAWRYDARVEIAIKASDPNRQLIAQASAAAKQSRTAPEDASLADREILWFALTENLMRQFDRTFTAQIRQDLAGFIR